MPEALELFGDKARARLLARPCGVPVLPGTEGATSLEAAKDFLTAHGPVMVKAVAGGGGRGMRPSTTAAELEEAYARCASEALAAFGNGDLYVERFLARARHIEVQIVGDGASVIHLYDRECSLQRQRQKVIEIPPADMLPAELRQRLWTQAVALGKASGYSGVGTIEFLVDGEQAVFIEGNARLQVEHTVTEAVTGLDLVRLQLEIAAGASLTELGLTQAAVPEPRATRRRPGSISRRWRRTVRSSPLAGRFRNSNRLPDPASAWMGSAMLAIPRRSASTACSPS